MILQNSLSLVLNIRVCSLEEEIEANEFSTSTKLELLVNKEEALIIPMFSERLLQADIMNIYIYIYILPISSRIIWHFGNLVLIISAMFNISSNPSHFPKYIYIYIFIT